jgi:hypothetical protein
LTTTVNGVFFDIFPIPNLGCCAAGIPNVASLSYAPVSDSSDTAYGSAGAPFTTLSASYQTLLSSGAGSSTGNSQSFNLLGLNIGSQYILQWWTNDSGLVYGGTNSTTGTAGNAVTLDENTTNAVGGVGQWVIGTFTADDTFQTIVLSGPRPEINAFQLRVIPQSIPVPALAPAAWVVLASLLALSGAVRMRRS